MRNTEARRKIRAATRKAQADAKKSHMPELWPEKRHTAPFSARVLERHHLSVLRTRTQRRCRLSEGDSQLAGFRVLPESAGFVARFRDARTLACRVGTHADARLGRPNPAHLRGNLQARRASRRFSTPQPRAAVPRGRWLSPPAVEQFVIRLHAMVEGSQDS